MGPRSLDFTESTVPFSFATCFVLYELLALAPWPLSVALFSLLPIVSQLLLGRMRAGEHGRKAPADAPTGLSSVASPSQGDRPAIRMSLEPKSGLSSLALTIALCTATTMLRLYILHRDANMSERYFGAISLITVILTALLLGTIVWTARYVNLKTMYRWVLPALLLAHALYCAGTGGNIWGLLLASAVNGAAVFVIHLFYWISVIKGTALLDDDGERFLRWSIVGICAGKALGVAAALVILASASPLGSDTALAFAMAIVTVVAMLSCERAAALLSPQTPDRQPCEAQLAANLDSILSQQARVAARAYGLSNREEEVLAFLLAGRSRPYIRDALAVSLNTINTHVRRIYAKMDVHSYQELIDRVRGA